jgi:hypothetical protein
MAILELPADAKTGRYGHIAREFPLVVAVDSGDTPFVETWNHYANGMTRATTIAHAMAFRAGNCFMALPLVADPPRAVSIRVIVRALPVKRVSVSEKLVSGAVPVTHSPVRELHYLAHGPSSFRRGTGNHNSNSVRFQDRNRFTT